MKINNRENRSISAKKHYEHIIKNHKSDIEFSIQNTNHYSNFIKQELVYHNQQEIILDDIDSSSAVFKYKKGKTALLNFASYKNPGGGFLSGSKAQEEALCHDSTLYPVLEHFIDSFYIKNRKKINRSLYTNEALYSEDILFFNNGDIVKSDVITCAAPNVNSAIRNYNISLSENSDTLKERIDFIISIANEKQIDTLILGAYGCGVFGQNPMLVAEIFCEKFKNNNLFDKVIFAIPDNSSKNYISFMNIFSKFSI